MISLIVITVMLLSLGFVPDKIMQPVVIWWWHATLLVNRITGGFLAARASVVPPVKVSTWAVLKRAGIKFPASFVTLPSFVSKTSTYVSVSRRSNRFLGHQLLRLEKASASRNSALFWTIAMALIKRSRAYRMAALHKALPFWFYRYRRPEIRRLMQSVETLVAQESTELKSDRVYIPKADGIRVRSLGVPRLEWRVILTMWTVLLTLWLTPLLSKSQFGARPGIGVAHAWREILQKTVPSDYIYEFDLAGFFNSIKLRGLHRILEGEGQLPQKVNDWLYAMNINDPTPPKEGIHRSDPELGMRDAWQDPRLTQGVMFAPIRARRGVGGGAPWGGPWPNRQVPVRNREAPTVWTGVPDQTPGWKRSAISGVTQGLNWGPILSVVALEKSGIFDPMSRPTDIRIAEVMEDAAQPIQQPPMPGGFLGGGMRRRRGGAGMTLGMTIDRISVQERWTINLVQYLDDGLWYGTMENPMPNYYGPEGSIPAVITAEANPATLLKSPDSNFTALGLEFSRKESVVGFVKNYGVWTKPLKYLGITYQPSTDTVEGFSQSAIKREKLLRVLETRGFKAFQKCLLGMNPFGYGPVLAAKAPSPDPVERDSPLGRYAEDHKLGTHHWVSGALRGSFIYIPLCWLMWGGWTADGGVILPLPELLVSALISYLSGVLITPKGWSMRMKAGSSWRWYNVDMRAASTHFAAAYIRGCRTLPKRRKAAGNKLRASSSSRN